MQYRIKFPQNLKADIDLPTSKSISNRSLIIYALTHKGIWPQNLAICDDTDVMQKALSSQEEIVDINAAGTSMRFLTAYFSVTPGMRIITGSERMRNRPIRILVNALRSLGAEISYMEKEGYPPLKIKGKKLSGGMLNIDGNISSQFITALLLIGPTLEEGLQLKLSGEVTSRPYINMTLALMNKYGAKTYWENDSCIRVEPQLYKPTSLDIESDWSAASYWFAITSLAPKATINLNKLTIPSLQGDSKGADLFKQLGVKYEITKDGITLHKTKNIADHLKIDFTEIPDLVQTFVVVAALHNIPFCFTGVKTLRIKETDRINALITELGKLGYMIKAKGDEAIYWDGEKGIAHDCPVIETYEDHRMAMAFAPAAIKFKKLCINNPSVVTKSYPEYWNDLKLAGVEVLKK